MNAEDILRRVDARIDARSILRHPFYVAWRHGELTRDQLATYARAYYPHVAAFPRYLAAAIERAADPAVRSDLERNLADELGVPKPHPDLWLDFAEALGLARTDVASAPATVDTGRTVGVFERLTDGDTGTGIAALYAYESQQPEVAKAKADGLRTRYGLEDAGATAYFDVHAEADLAHREGERRSLVRCLEAGSDPDAVLRAVDEALAAYWSLLDGICRDAGIDPAPM